MLWLFLDCFRQLPAQSERTNPAKMFRHDPNAKDEPMEMSSIETSIEMSSSCLLPWKCLPKVISKCLPICATKPETFARDSSKSEIYDRADAGKKKGRRS